MPTEELYNILSQVESIADDAIRNVCFLLTISELAIEADGIRNSEVQLNSVAFLTKHHAETVLDTINSLQEIVENAKALFPRTAIRPNTDQHLQADKDMLQSLISTGEI